MKKTLILAISLACSPAIFAQTVTYTGAPDAIPDNDLPNPLCTNVTVPSGTVSSTSLVSVDFAITHSWVSDLVITLASPAATTVTLLDGTNQATASSTDLDAAFPLVISDTGIEPEATLGENGGAGCAGADVVGDTCGSASVSPEQPLSTFNGESAAGMWTLCIGDGAGGDTGDLTSWSMVGDGTLPVELQSFSID